MGLQEEEEAAVNKLINQLEDTGKQQVGWPLHAAQTLLAVYNQLLCYTGTAPSQQSSDIWQLCSCLLINTASSKAEWTAYVALSSIAALTLKAYISALAVTVVLSSKSGSFFNSCWWRIQKQARPPYLPDKGALPEYFQAKSCNKQGVPCQMHHVTVPAGVMKCACILPLLSQC